MFQVKVCFGYNPKFDYSEPAANLSEAQHTAKHAVEHIGAFEAEIYRDGQLIERWH